MPVDPSTADFISDEVLYQFTEYDPDRANELLDEMGLTERDSDGFRLRFDGEPFVILLQFAPQGGPVETHELVKGYWEAVGVRVLAKEVSSDFYRSTSSANEHDLATWRGASGATAINDVVMFPPFGDYLQIRTGVQWSEWMLSDGAEGIEPPEDIKKLWDLAAEWKTYPLGSAENSRVGAEIMQIHADNLLSLGVIGNVPSPVYVNDRIGNAIEFTVKSYNYYWAYAFRPTQWFIKE